MTTHRHVLLAVATIFVLSFSTVHVVGMVPFFAHDTGVQIVDWGSSASMFKPEIARLIVDNSTVYMENGDYLGDARYFYEQPNPPAIMQYVGFGALWFGEPVAQLDPGRKSKTREGNYFHSTDPSTLYGWRTSAGVELRWTPDYRFVTRTHYGELNSGTPVGTVDSYNVHRLRIDNGAVTIISVGGESTSFLDTTAVAGIDYEYSMESVEAIGGDPVPFTTTPVTVTDEDQEPHFWVEKADYQERHYIALIGAIGDTNSLNWPFRFYVDSNLVTSADVTIELVQKSIGADYVYTPLTDLGYSYDANSGQGALTMDWSTDTSYLTGIGGIVYRLHYNDGANDIYYPPEGPAGKKHFIWSSINNRTMGRKWLNYVTNTGSDDWRQTYQEMATRLANGVDLSPGQTAGLVRYDRIFMDSVMAASTDTHNNIRPYEFTTTADYLNGAIATTRALCDSCSVGFVANTPDLGFMEGMTGYPGFVGVMDEGLLLGKDGWRKLGHLLWTVHGRPTWQNVLAASLDFGTNIDDRRQLFVGYMLARAANPVQGNEGIAYGYLDWDNAPAEEAGNVNIFAEQFLEFGSPILDHFSGTVWPNQADWGSAVYSEETLASWLGQNTVSSGETKFVRVGGTRNFALQEYYLEDGMPDSVTTAIAFWDIGDTTGTGSFTLQELFPDKMESAEYYRVEFDNTSVTRGGWISSALTATTGSEVLPTSANQVQLYFSRHIESPTIGPDTSKTFVPSPSFGVHAEYGLSVSPGINPLLAVQVSQWNGQRLAEVRIDLEASAHAAFINGGWPATQPILLTDDGPGGNNGDLVADDGVYSWSGPPIPSVAIGSYEFPVVATGSDGLVRYGSVVAQATQYTGIQLVNGSSNTGALNDNTILGVPVASAAFDYNGDGYPDLMVSARESASGVNGRGRLFARATSLNGVPVFDDRSALVSSDIDFMSSNNLPQAGHRGIATTEFTPGETVVFMAHPDQAPRLYFWDPDSLKFADKAAAVFDIIPAQSYDGAWDDYDGDGLVDLLVARSTLPDEGGAVASASAPSGPSSAFAMLYHHTFDGANHHLNYVSDTAVFPAVGDYSFEATWCNVDGTDTNNQAWPDVFLPNLWTTEAAVLLINQGFDPVSGQGSFLDRTSDWFTTGEEPRGVRSSVFQDLDNDGDEDLVVACWGQDDNLAIYENTGSAFKLLAKQENFVPVEPFSLNGVAVADFDGNTYPDILVTPLLEQAEPYILVNGVAADPLVFSRFGTLSMGSGAARGAAIADWGNDLDPDIYLGRASDGGSFYFVNERVAGQATAHWAKIRLLGDGGNSCAGIGAKVAVTDPGFETTKVLRPKSGMNQSPLELLLPLPGFTAGTVNVRITWPSGYVQTAVCNVDQLSEIQDDSYLIVPGTVVPFYSPAPTGNDWGAEWVTKGPVPVQNSEMVFSGTIDMNSPCFCGGTVHLTANDAEVEVSQTRVANGWKTRFVWHDGCCHVQKPACANPFTVTSSNRYGSDTSGPHNFVTFKVCGFGF